MYLKSLTCGLFLAFLLFIQCKQDNKMPETSVKGADCSGFVQSIYYLNGCVIARDDSQQILYGKDVSIENNRQELKPGDLLFFGQPSPNEFPHNITHIGIYLGDSQFVHSSGRIKSNSLDSTRSNYSAYNSSRLYAARRIIDSNQLEGVVALKDHRWY